MTTTTKTEQLIAVRDLLQNLLDTYQIRDPGMVDFKSAMVGLQTAIDMPDPKPEVIEQPVVGTDAVIAGVLAGLQPMRQDVVGIGGEVLKLADATAAIKAAVAAVEADTAQLRQDTTKIISNTTPVAA